MTKNQKSTTSSPSNCNVQTSHKTTAHTRLIVRNPEVRSGEYPPTAPSQNELPRTKWECQGNAKRIPRFERSKEEWISLSPYNEMVRPCIARRDRTLSQRQLSFLVTLTHSIYSFIHCPTNPFVNHIRRTLTINQLINQL